MNKHFIKQYYRSSLLDRWLDSWLALCWKTMKMEAACVHLTGCVALHPRSPSCWSYFALNSINQLLLKCLSGPWLWRQCLKWSLRVTLDMAGSPRGFYWNCITETAC